MPAPKLNLVIEVPTISRTKDSSADQAIVAAMADQLTDSNWVSDGNTYADYQKASNASQIYRRAAAVKLGTEAHKIKTRVWGVDGDKIVTDREAKATWRFALASAPDRVKRTRKPKA